MIEGILSRQSLLDPHTIMDWVYMTFPALVKLDPLPRTPYSRHVAKGHITMTHRSERPSAMASAGQLTETAKST